MKFLAWDIGIKNLAYNIVDYQPEKEDPYVILKWGIINLINDVDEVADEAITNIICSGKLKSGKPCSQKSKYISDSNRDLGYCSKHGKEEITKETNDLIPIKRNMTCIAKVTKNKETNSCNKTGYWLNQKNPYLCYCQTHLKQMKQTNETGKYYMDPRRAKKVKQFNIKELSVTLFEELSKIDDFLDVSEIIIENQPVFKNPTMKSIQMMLYSYFVMKGLMHNKVNNIAFFMAGKKLEAFTGNHQLAKDKFGHIKSEYKQTKNSAILFCKEMIKKNQSEWLQYINAQPKQDDLADAFLTNCCYIQNTYLVNLKKQEKRKETANKKKAKEEQKKLKEELKKQKEELKKQKEEEKQVKEELKKQKEVKNN